MLLVSKSKMLKFFFSNKQKQFLLPFSFKEYQLYGKNFAVNLTGYLEIGRAYLEWFFFKNKYKNVIV